MDDTDFDVLCEGASPAEAKQLRKLLAEWCDGDENSFPLQLALLTRAQWRAAASVPRLVGDARELLLLKLDERMHTIQTAFDDLDEATRARLDALKQIETEDSAKRREAIAVIEAQMLKAQAVATMISSDLEKGRTNWVAARNEYDAARRRLESAEQQLQARLNIRDWTVLLLLLFMAGLVGACLALGFYPSSATDGIPRSVSILNDVTDRFVTTHALGIHCRELRQSFGQSLLNVR